MCWMVFTVLVAHFHGLVWYCSLPFWLVLLIGLKAFCVFLFGEVLKGNWAVFWCASSLGSQ